MVKRTAPSPRNVIRRNAEAVAWYPHLGEVNESGRAVHNFDGPITIRASIRPPSSNNEFGVARAGAEETAIYHMDVIDAVATGDVATDTQADDTTPTALYGRNIDNDDRIVWMNDAWRCTQRRMARRNGFSRFILVEDGRDTHSDVTTEGPDSPDQPPGETTTDDGWEIW